MTKYTELPDNKNRIFGGAYGIHDPELTAARDDLISRAKDLDFADPHCAEQIKSEFLETYQRWMFDAFDFPGTDLYRYACFTQGTTESFAQFYIRYRDGHRLRIKKGEYFYHQMMKSLWYGQKFAWLEDDQIRPGDVLLISVPFADTGSCPEDLELLLTRCDDLEVPVMLDMAYLNITVGSVLQQKIDLRHPCIKYVVSSLSKAFPVENFRIGIRLQKELYEDQIYVVNEHNYNYINLFSAYLGQGLMQRFAPDHMFNKYRDRQLQTCQDMGLDPSPCYIFGIDRHNRYPQYNRGGATNRLCFSRMWDGRGERFGLVA